MARQKRKAASADGTAQSAKRLNAGPPPHDLQKPPSHPPSFFDLVDRYPIYDRLCSVLPLDSAIKLSQTCRTLHSAFLRSWDVDKSLQRFVKHPLRLRSELGRHGSLIAGHFALQFFAREKWPDIRLSIYVDQGVASTAMLAYLSKEEQYTFKEIVPKFMEGRRPSNIDRKSAIILLRLTTTSPAACVLLDRATTNLFAQEGLHVKKVDSEKYLDTVLHKLYKRGWGLDDVPRDETTRNTSLLPMRRIGDRYTWQIQLPTQDVIPSTIPDSVLESSFFSIDGVRSSSRSSDRAQIRSYTLSAQLFSHIALMYSYLIANDIDPSRVDQIRQELSRNAMFDLFAMKAGDRPPWFQRNLLSSGRDFVLYDHDNVRDFKRPHYLRSRDDYMISMLKQFHRVRGQIL
ncbi:hypothetical protein H2200_013006 [Cladophialophora chaetospira]|uniref:Uncharacterized protein n=1 Tax=Cladophialophora chaetospira TaxID=386627 RepID=A0AA39CBP5_9EURO|nr:hypothetical protein H2200_013006 [Cladophialophora chaetospira]